MKESKKNIKKSGEEPTLGEEIKDSGDNSMSIFDPLALATELTLENEKEVQRTRTIFKTVSPMASIVWGDDTDVNMTIPADGWNTRHWRRYFAAHYKLIYRTIYTGNTHQDRAGLSQVLFKARHELEMSNEEIKAFFDWVAENKMKRSNQIGQIYLIRFLVDHLSEYFNFHIYPQKHADSKSKIVSRNIVIDNTDLRVEISKFIVKDDHGCIIHVEPRLYTQFGLAIMVYYFMQQEDYSLPKAQAQIAFDIAKIIREDVNNNQSERSVSPRFERIVKNSILWEPLAWKGFDWRNDQYLRKLITYFGYDNKDNGWWHENPPIAFKPATCLKTLKAKKRKK